MSDEEEVRRGELAQQVLENEVYIDSFGLIEQEVFKKWQDSRDKEEREQLHQFLLALRKSRQVLEQTLRTGKVALDKLKRDRGLIGRLRSAA